MKLDIQERKRKFRAGQGEADGSRRERLRQPQGKSSFKGLKEKVWISVCRERAGQGTPGRILM